MKSRTNLNTSVVMTVILLTMAGTTFAGPSLFPLQVGLRYELNKSDDIGTEWPVHAEVTSHVTINSLDYFHIQMWNEDNDGAYEDKGLHRSTETALYGYNPSGDDYLEYQTAPVGTKWIYYEEDSGFNYKVTEIVAIEPVTVPYGTFDTAYKHRAYRCEFPDWYGW